MVEVKLLKKMSGKEIMGITAKDNAAKEEWLKLAKEHESKHIFTISGEVTAYGSKSTNFGPAIFLLGAFVGRNNLTGKMFKASKVYLPSKSDAENVVASFDTLRKSDMSGVLAFVYDYTVIEDSSSSTGYTFVSEIEKAPEQVTREAALIGRMSSKPLLLTKQKGKVA